MTTAANDHDGRVVLVTGGARGVGRAITRAFARRGAHVVVNYFHAVGEAPKLFEELTAEGASVELIRASVADANQVEAMFDDVARRHGGVDVLVNNAASGALLPLARLHESHWQRALDTNLRGSLWCARRAAPLMARRGGGAIVNLSSIGSSLVIGDYVTVGTSKAAVEALTRYLAVEFAADGIRVNTASGGLLDGTVATLFPDAERLAERVREATPLGHRLGREEELAELVVFLASPAASWITGQTVVADGGLSLGAALLSPRPTRQPAPVEPADGVPVTTPIPAPAPIRTPTPVAMRSEVAAIPTTATVAVVGVGVVTPGANDADELWKVLSEGRNVFGRPRLFDVESFHSADPAADDKTYTRESGFITDFRPHPRLEAELADDPALSRESTTVWLRHCLHTALQDVRRRADDRYFAAFGYTADGSQELEGHLVLSGYLRRLGARLPRHAVRLLRERYDRLGQPPHECLPHRVGRNAIAGLLPDETELLMVDTACSSSLYAIDFGVKALREGSAEVAVCGGAFAYSARNLVLFSKLQGLSRSGAVRCFDRGADGVLFSDGAGVVVLKRLDRARADGDRVLGIVDGIGLSCDGGGKAVYAPSAPGQAIALRRAYGSAGVDASDVGWVIAHATGTKAGDSTELIALRDVAARGGPALLSSNKAVVGHTGWAAGLVSVSQALSGLARDEVPVQPYLHNVIPAVATSRFTPPAEHPARGIPRASRAGRSAADAARRPRHVGISSFGFGGTNAHLVLTEDDQDNGDRIGSARDPVADEDVAIVGWAADLPGDDDPDAWLRGTGRAPAPGFGDDYPLPGWQEVKLPPATLRNMDRTQIMVLRAAAKLDAPVRAALARLHDTAGVVVGHTGPTRRAVHYALRCYLDDLDRALADLPEHDADLRPSLDRLAADVRALISSSTEDSFPGIMPNIIPARLAGAWDFHGLNATVDGGPDSGLDALRAAERYLRHGDLDVVVVAGVNGNSTDEFREVLASAGETDQPAEGAFVVVLARESTARAESLPVLGRLRSRVGPTDPATRPRLRAPLAGSGRTYLGADPVVGLLAQLVGGSGRTTIGAASARGTQVELTVPARVTRAVRRLHPTRPRRIRPALPPLPPGCLLVVSAPGLLDGITLPRDVRVVVAPATGPGPLPDADELTGLLPDDPPSEHVRVLVGLDADTRPPTDLSALAGLRGSHDMAFLAAKRWRGGRDSSYAVLLTGAVRSGVPHPATGPFTGLVKALAREAPSALVFAVATDLHDTGAALELLGDESARAHDLAVVVHASGRRMEYQPVPDATPDLNGGLPRGGVVVAAGGTRGLTARLLTRLVEETDPEAVYLLGRHAPVSTRLPSRAAFLAEQLRERPEAGAARLSVEYDRLAAASSTADTVRRLAERCGDDRVRFIGCDLTDPEQTRAAVGRVLAAHPAVDLLVNAAGAHSGGLVTTTSLDTMRTVRDTKVLTYLNLHTAFADRRPERWLNIGSLLAVLGWPGEADYCSANDVLGVAAQWQAAMRGSREATFGSPLWDESGFAAVPLVRDLLRSRNALTGLSDREGVTLVLDELRRGMTDPEVTYLGAAEKRLLTTTRRHAVEVSPSADGRGLTWRPHPALDDYFRSHRLHGAPTLPGAWICEPAVAAGLHGRDEGAPVAVTGLVFHAPITIQDGPGGTCYIEVSDDGPGVARVRLTGDVVARDGRVLRRDRLHAEAAVVFGGHQPAPGPAPPPGPGPGPGPSPGPAPGQVFGHAPGRGLDRHTAPLPGSGFRYDAAGPVALDPPFTCLTDVRAGRGRARARFRPALDQWIERFAGLRLPVLLVDGLVQCALIANSAAGPLPIPTAVDRVDFLTCHNDVELLDRHGGHLVVVADTTGATALAPDGTPLVRVHGVHAVQVASAEREVGHVAG
ncbi:NAD(P)-dependent dehydrogenase (short-subunit alcohol dehydrogenase family)/3-oxoacyl-(acyl-carrier-protein) synthase [Saccharothrix tamanrassetensis]|uniref:NAD(P)-dependent dehydrogenase (Short-subunit alcohol dehydrogenase family)/3-oxoacyl-(Acyl-carrier-protein) synthase n=1 Tax=Saccharothrix tamanrassetensis TaxID=1051531 RepID=A0A841CLZ6_9PSEU|nr:SDR family oxidoreductase [Saccharothrix tamanrassetensis]MBB5957178.1 NAD(P)-dependent dehydrogenase (short-subunit alcohol dehydrogenase family)/3-oxoacyl-(acyl-carrier-protein) synthase [Saccharothrix tamanrassetensis]